MSFEQERDAAYNEAKRLMRKSMDQIQTWSMCMFIGGVSLLGGAAWAWVIPMSGTTDEEKQSVGLWIMAFAATVLIIGFASKSASNEKFNRARDIAERYGFDTRDL